jgi:hypothetical protein
MIACCRLIPKAILLLNDQYHDNAFSLIQWQMIEYFAHKGINQRLQPLEGDTHANTLDSLTHALMHLC